MFPQGPRFHPKKFCSGFAAAGAKVQNPDGVLLVLQEICSLSQAENRLLPTPLPPWLWVQGGAVLMGWEAASAPPGSAGICALGGRNMLLFLQQENGWAPRSSPGMCKIGALNAGLEI